MLTPWSDRVPSEYLRNQGSNVRQPLAVSKLGEARWTDNRVQLCLSSLSHVRILCESEKERSYCGMRLDCPGPTSESEPGVRNKARRQTVSRPAEVSGLSVSPLRIDNAVTNRRIQPPRSLLRGTRPLHFLSSAWSWRAAQIQSPINWSIREIRRKEYQIGRTRSSWTVFHGLSSISCTSCLTCVAVLWKLAPGNHAGMYFTETNQ